MAQLLVTICRGFGKRPARIAAALPLILRPVFEIRVIPRPQSGGGRHSEEGDLRACSPAIRARRELAGRGCSQPTGAAEAAIVPLEVTLMNPEEQAPDVRVRGRCGFHCPRPWKLQLSPCHAGWGGIPRALLFPRCHFRTLSRPDLSWFEKRQRFPVRAVARTRFSPGRRM